MSRLLRLLILVVFILAPGELFSQEQDVFVPVRVDGPRISRTVFTNWEEIKLTYTVGYIDGYEMVWDELKPSAMSFGVLELDPEFAEELDKRNERPSDNKENYFDVVYHLRFMNEKKGEIVIPGQRFAYRKIQAGNSVAEYVTTRQFLLDYKTVLTSDADDIKEDYDQGSYKNLANKWKISGIALILLGVSGSLFLVFFKPVSVPLLKGVGNNDVPETSPEALNLNSVISSVVDNIAKGDVRSVCDGLNDLIRIYVPEIGPGVPSRDMAKLIGAVPYQWERDRLLKIHKNVCDIEEYLYGDMKGPSPSITSLTAIQELKPSKVYWRRRMFNLKLRLLTMIPFSLRRSGRWLKNRMTKRRKS